MDPAAMPITTEEVMSTSATIHHEDRTLPIGPLVAALVVLAGLAVALFGFLVAPPAILMIFCIASAASERSLGDRLR